MVGGGLLVFFLLVGYISDKSVRAIPSLLTFQRVSRQSIWRIVLLMEGISKMVA